MGKKIKKSLAQEWEGQAWEIPAEQGQEGAGKDGGGREEGLSQLERSVLLPKEQFLSPEEEMTPETPTLTWVMVPLSHPSTCWMCLLGSHLLDF